jgi:OOP family OmpA-OmpF porin
MAESTLQERAETAPPVAKTDTNAPEADGWQELRGLLLRPEQEKLADFASRFDDPERHAEEISEVLPQAIVLRSAQDKRLAKALQPTFEESLRVSIKKDPRPFVDAVTPVMGAAIRKAIAEALSAMMQSLNRTLDNSISLQSLKWRLEALRTGKSFPEVVMLHTLEYRVEQVFLIHRETGLLLQHAVAKGDEDEVQDADMVSGMLTAIQDFVRDAANAEGTLNDARIGEKTLWAEQGPQAVIAGFIRGTPPQDLRPVFQDALDSIHLEFHDQLTDFAGDAEPFDASQPYLQACLQARYHEAKNKRLISPPVAIALGALALALLVFGFFHLRSYLRWRDYLSLLQKEPGLVVVSAEHGFFSHSIEGLRDPLAADPAALLQQAGLNPAKVAARWDEYQALHPRFLEQRAQRLLEPPATVQLSVSKGTLYANGAAPPEWIAEARKLSRGLAGVREFAYTGDTQTDIRTVETSRLRFASGSAELTPEAKTEFIRLSQLIRGINAATPAGCRVEITGRADPPGSQAVNEVLSRLRAEAARDALIAAGFPAAQIQIQSAGANKIEGEARENADSRSVTFRVIPNSAQTNR